MKGPSFEGRARVPAGFWHSVKVFPGQSSPSLRFDARSARLPLRAFVLLAALLDGACATYAPRPIDVQAHQRQFAQRTLDDAELARFAMAQPNAPHAFPPERWGIDELTLVAWHFNAALSQARAHRDAAHAQARLEGGRANPSLSFDLERVTNGGPRPWSIGFTFDVPLELGSRREARRDVAERAADTAELELGATAWRLRSDVRRALTRVIHGERELPLVRDEIEVREHVSASAARAVEVGEAESGLALAARAALDRARADAAAIEREVRSARGDLARAVALPVGALDRVELDEPRAPATDRELPELLELGLHNRLDLRVALVEYARSEAALRLEIAAQFPDVQILPGYQWDQAAHKLRFGFSLPLPVFTNQRPAIERASAQRDEAQAHVLAVQDEMVNAIESAHAAWLAAVRERDAFVEAARSAQSLVSSAERAVAAGALERTELDARRIELVTGQRAALQAADRAQTALGELEDALQCPLAGAELVPPLATRNEELR